MVLSFNYGSPHKLLGPAMPRISRRSMKLAMELKKQKLTPDTPPPMEPNKKEKMHIYQCKKEEKEYHAIEDYYWFYEEWTLITKRFVEKFGRRLQDVLMEYVHLYRVKVENSSVMENVKTFGDLFPLPFGWEKSLRGGNNDKEGIPAPSGPSFAPLVKNGGRKVVARIGYADKLHPPFMYFPTCDAHLHKKEQDWGSWEWLCNNMAEGLRRVEPCYPEFAYLKVFGECLRGGGGPTRDRCWAWREAEKARRHPKPIALEDVERPVRFECPCGYLSPRRLHFACKPGELMGHMVKLENVGNSVLFYRWEQKNLEFNGLTTPTPTVGNGRNFSVLNMSGNVLPGEIAEFKFNFRSDVEGFFMESWVLHTAPKLRRPFKPISLKAVATLQDPNRELCNKLAQCLDSRELLRGIGENFESIQDKAIKLSRPTEEFRKSNFMFAPQAFDFIRINLSMEPPVYFIPSVYTKLEVLARAVGDELKRQPPTVEVQVPAVDSHQVYNKSKGKYLGSPLPTEDQISASKSLRAGSSGAESASNSTLFALLGPGSVVTGARSQTTRSQAATRAPSPTSVATTDVWDAEEPEDVWNGSVMAISDGIGMIQVEWIREQAQEQFNELLCLAQIPPHQTALFHFAMYRTLHDLAGAVEEIFERVTKASINPSAELLLQNFYKNYQQEAKLTSQKEKPSSPEPAEKSPRKRGPDVRGKLDTAKVDKGQTAENKEMLTYCFNWIQIMSELRCTVPDGFNHYQADIHQEQAAVMDLIEQKVGDTHVDDDTKCWRIFSLERHKLELMKEQRRLAELTCCM